MFKREEKIFNAKLREYNKDIIEVQSILKSLVKVIKSRGGAINIPDVNLALLYNASSSTYRPFEGYFNLASERVARDPEEVAGWFGFKLDQPRSANELLTGTAFLGYTLNKEMPERYSPSRRNDTHISLSSVEDFEKKTLMTNFLAFQCMLKYLRYSKNEQATKAVAQDPCRANRTRTHKGDIVEETRREIARLIGPYYQGSPIYSKDGWRGDAPFVTRKGVNPDVPVGVYPTANFDSVPVAMNRKQAKTLSTFGDLIVKAGSRKAQITAYKEYDLPEAAEEDIEVFEVTLSYQMHKRDLKVPNSSYRIPRSYDCREDVEKAYPIKDAVFLTHRSNGNLGTTDRDEWLKADGFAVVQDKQGHMWTKLRTKILPSNKITNLKQGVVVPHNIPNGSAGWAKAIPTRETRYLCRYKTTSGEYISVTGTSPKRALANIRRTIRDNIVETLDIF